MLNPQLWIHSAITFLSSLAGTGILMEKNDIHSYIGAIVNSCPRSSNGFQDCTVSLYFLDTELFIVVFPKCFHFSQIPNSFIPQFCLFLNTKVEISKVFFSFFLSFFFFFLLHLLVFRILVPQPRVELLSLVVETNSQPPDSQGISNVCLYKHFETIKLPTSHLIFSLFFN